MTSVQIEVPIAARPERVWSLIGAFGDGSWMGDVSISCQGEGLGAVRTVGLPTGPAVERCIEWDAESMAMGYAIVSGNPFPVTGYSGRMEVLADGDGSILRWSGTFDDDHDPDVPAAIEVFYRRAAKAIARHLTS